MFKCAKCGECCRNLDKCEVYRDLDRGDGVCKYLEGKLCSVYAKRPLLCRVDDSYRLFEKEYSKEEYYRLNYEACKKLQEEKEV